VCTMWLWSCFDGLGVIIPSFFASLFLALFAFIYKCFSCLHIGISGFVLLYICNLDALSKSVELNYSRVHGFHGPELPMTSPSESFIYLAITSLSVSYPSSHERHVLRCPRTGSG
jgi:hypothetical protein